MAPHPDFLDSPHAVLDPEIRWFPADEALREAVETIMYLYAVAKTGDKFDLMLVDGSGSVSTGMFDESW